LLTSYIGSRYVIESAEGCLGLFGIRGATPPGEARNHCPMLGVRELKQHIIVVAVYLLLRFSLWIQRLGVVVKQFGEGLHVDHLAVGSIMGY